jgi:hypothetical protein
MKTMFNFYKKYLFIFFAFILAYFLSSFSIKHIFLANSPKIRPNLGGYFLAKMKNTKDRFLAFFNSNIITKSNYQNYGNNTQLQLPPQLASTNNKEKIEAFLKENLKPITKGVRAASVPGYSYTEFRLNEIEWARITYTLKNGKKITIEYPKGTKPPPKEIYED